MLRRRCVFFREAVVGGPKERKAHRKLECQNSHTHLVSLPQQTSILWVVGNCGLEASHIPTWNEEQHHRLGLRLCKDKDTHIHVHIQSRELTHTYMHTSTHRYTHKGL